MFYHITKKLPRKGYLAPAAREFYPDLQELKHNDPLLMKALKLGKCYYDEALKDENEITEPAAKSKYHQAGGGKKHCTISL